MLDARRRSMSSGRAATRVYVDRCCGAGSSGSSVRRATLEGVDVGASVRGSLALERAARAWALLRRARVRLPADVEHLFLPVVVHRIVFTPSFVAEARERGGRRRRSRSAPVRGARAAPRRRPRRASRRRGRPLGAAAELTFPLKPGRRLRRLPYGSIHSARRGSGSDVAGSRPYRPRRRRRRDRLARVGSALARARDGRVRRARALRRRGAAGRRSLRPASLDVALSRDAGRGSRSRGRSADACG